MNCKHFKRRSKNYKYYLYCNKLKKEITFDDCRGCEFKEYKQRKPIKVSKPINAKKPIKQRTYKQAKLERDRFSIITDDLKICIECGNENSNINIHEIFYGTGKRKLSIKYGLVIPLCSDNCHDQVNMTGIHFDLVMRDKWYLIGQKKAMEYYNWDKEEFIKIFGRNYLK